MCHLNCHVLCVLVAIARVRHLGHVLRLVSVVGSPCILHESELPVPVHLQQCPPCRQATRFGSVLSDGADAEMSRLLRIAVP
jgi:hypothetical protein